MSFLTKNVVTLIFNAKPLIFKKNSLVSNTCSFSQQLFFHCNEPYLLGSTMPNYKGVCGTYTPHFGDTDDTIFQIKYKTFKEYYLVQFEHYNHLIISIIAFMLISTRQGSSRSLFLLFSLFPILITREMKCPTVGIFFCYFYSIQSDIDY